MLMSSALLTLVIILVFAYTGLYYFRQKKLSDIKNDFINNMTHELKTPIATIRLASEAIVNPGVIHDSEKVQHYTRIINDENNRMNEHVENILRMAQFNRTEFIRERKETDMHEVIPEVIDKMQLQVIQKNGSIRFDAGASSFLLPVDRKYISIVLTNLIDNAIKYNTGIPTINIETENSENEFVIAVTDNGYWHDCGTM